MSEIFLPKKKNVVMDATLLTSLMSCARFVDLRFNHSLEPNTGKGNALEVGSIIHKVLEVYYKNIVNGFSRNVAITSGMSAGEMYIKGCSHCTGFIPTDETPKPICGHPPNEYPGVVNTPVESEGYKTGWKHALNTCEQYFEHYKSDYWVPLEVEKVVGKVLYEDDEIRILWKAKLDLRVDTNQGIFPADHKTMKQRRDTISLNNQFIGQCLVCDTRNAIVNKIGLQTSLKPIDKFSRAIVSYSADRLLEWQSEILPFYAYQLIAYTESGYYPPNFSHCENKFGFCQFKGICESDRRMRNDELQLHFVKGAEWNPTNAEE